MVKDKLNPLRTKFDVILEIDDLEYKVVFKPVNQNIQKKLNKGREKNKAQYEDIDSKRVQLKEIRELKSVNDEILKTHGEIGGIKTEQKTSILLENKNYVSQISALEKEIKELEKGSLDLDAAVEQYYKEMFNECVTGGDKTKLQKKIEDDGISYSVISVYLNDAMRVSQEKK